MPKQPTDFTDVSGTQVKPKPELEEGKRRVFTAEYKLRIITQADQCKHGELGELLRKEGLYAAQLSKWRREFASSGVDGLSKTAPGPKSKLTAEGKRIAQLERDNAKLKRQLGIAEDCLELQKKTLSIMDQMKRDDYE